ncbi:MAG: Fe-S cluster assembly protein SufD [SAR202 cluster bacterium Io17-Chloro-G3]|nr:MAG: Fe-S cluster assembly protein SufD [SAR202 cluster bacterium Io17-Chloro-G3]
MTQPLRTQEPVYLESFEAFQRDSCSRDPSWLRSLRHEAISQFKDLGFPTQRRGNEEWKYTDIRPIAHIPFRLPTNPLSKPSKTSLLRFPFDMTQRNRLVFLDGHLEEELSSLLAVPYDKYAVNLTEAIASSDGTLEKHLAHDVNLKTNPFVSLNTAFMNEGAFINIPDESTVEEPIYLFFLNTAKEENTIVYPRVLVVAGEKSKATIIEIHSSLSNNSTKHQYFTNSVTEIALGKDSQLSYYKAQTQPHDSFHITHTQAILGQNSNFTSLNFDFGGGLVRNNLNILMNATGARCTLNGLYMLTGSQHIDNQVIVDHTQGHTTTRELYKGVLDGQARSVFHGSIIVREGAVKVDADQSDKNLLLSDHAEADTKPAFWIYCDDVRCSHGAACGKLDENALFYLSSRGISDQAARALMTHGFVTDIIESIGHTPFRSNIDVLVRNILDQWLSNTPRT